MRNWKIVLLGMLCASSLSLGQNYLNLRGITAKEFVKTDTLKGTSTYLNVASRMKFLGAIDVQSTGVFRQPVVFQDTTTLTNVAVFYQTWTEFRKNLLLYDRQQTFFSPNLIFKQDNGSTFDSAAISFDNPGTVGRAIKFSTPLEFASWNTANLSGLTSGMGFSGDTVWFKGPAGNIIRFALVPGVAGQAFGLINTNTYAPISIAGGGGGSGNGVKIRYDDLSFTLYPDTMQTFKKRNFILATGAGKEVIINTIQNIGPTDTTTFSAQTITNALTAGTINSGRIRATGISQFDSLLVSGSPSVSGTSALYAQNNSGSSAASIALFTGQGSSALDIRANGDAYVSRQGKTTNVSNAAIFDYIGSRPRATIGTTAGIGAGRFYAGDSLYLGSTLVMDALRNIVNVPSITVDDAGIPGSTVIAQLSASAMSITNTGSLWLDMPSLKFTNSPAMPFVGTMTVQNFSGNRSWLLPDRSGTFVASATAPLLVDAVTGNMTFNSTFLSSLNGLTGNPQVFAVGSAGTAPNIVSSGLTHTFNFPLAGTGVTNGGVSNGAQTIVGNKLFQNILRTTAFEGGMVTTSGPIYNVSTQAQIFRADPTGGFPVVFQLPDVTGIAGRTYLFYRQTTTTPNVLTVTVVPNGVQTIDGLSSIVLTDQFDYIAVTTEGLASTGWKVTGGQIGGTAYGIKQGFAFTAYLRTAGDTVDVAVPGMTTSGQISGVMIHDPSITILPTTFNAFVYTNRIAMRSSTHYAKDSVIVKGFYTKQ